MTKPSILSIALLLFISSCNSQQDARTLAIAEKNAIETLKPGTIAATTGGWTMTAKIDGRDWKATSLMSPEAAGRYIGYYKDEYIGLPRFEQKYAQLGKKIIFKEGNAVDLSVSGDDNFYGGYSGEMEITKLNGDWLEAKFHFTATSHGSDRTIRVTDGFYRIQYGK